MNESTQSGSRKNTQGAYNFEQLIKANPDLQKHVHMGKSERLTIDFGDSVAVKELNRAILYNDYGVIKWNIPSGYLCPPVPGRAEYVKAASGLLSESLGPKNNTGPKITCLDIGAGSNCIYPIIGIHNYNWKFIATETDKIALKNIHWLKSKNPKLNKQLIVREQLNSDLIFKGIVNTTDIIDCTICNPPFYASQEEANKANSRKSKNLSGTKKGAANFNFGGSGKELWYRGGELAFITKMIRESKQYASNVYWFTSLVSSEKNVPKIIQALKGINVNDFKVIEMGIGNKKSRIVAWTFLNKKLRLIWNQSKK